jgi:hypothetical protein
MRLNQLAEDFKLSELIPGMATPGMATPAPTQTNPAQQPQQPGAVDPQARAMALQQRQQQKTELQKQIRQAEETLANLRKQLAELA